MNERLHVRIRKDLHDWLERVSTGPGTSKSAIVNDALDAYAHRQAAIEIDPVIIARLDRLTAQAGEIVKLLLRLERNQHIGSETLALAVRFLFMVTAPLPEADQSAARALSQERFATFLDQVSRRVAQGKSLLRDVLDHAPREAREPVPEAAE